jgi:hypothetical protein
MLISHLPAIRTRVRSDFQQSSATGFIADSEIDAWANEAYYKYCARLIMANQGYFDTTASLDLTANVEAIALPNNFLGSRDFLRMVRVERVLPTVRVPLKYRKRFDEGNPTISASIGQTYLPTYDFRGNNLILEPMPTFTELNAGGTAGLLITFPALPPKLQSGNAVAGASTTITLDATADPRDDYYNSAKIFIYSGTGAGQIRTISDYVGSTRVATVSVAWDTNPDTSSVFSTLIDDDFPEIFHEIIPMYATKMAFGKERSFGSQRAYDASGLKEKETELMNFCQDKTIARQFVQPFHPEIWT